MSVNWEPEANLDSRENNSCVGMGETWSDPLTDTLSLTVIFGLRGTKKMATHTDNVSDHTAAKVERSAHVVVLRIL